MVVKVFVEDTQTTLILGLVLILMGVNLRMSVV